MKELWGLKDLTIHDVGGSCRPVQGYLAQENKKPSYDPTAGLYLGSYGGPRGVGVSYERGSPVHGWWGCFAQVLLSNELGT